MTWMGSEPSDEFLSRFFGGKNLQQIGRDFFGMGKCGKGVDVVE